MNYYGQPGFNPSLPPPPSLLFGGRGGFDLLRSSPFPSFSLFLSPSFYCLPPPHSISFSLSLVQYFSSFPNLVSFRPLDSLHPSRSFSSIQMAKVNFAITKCRARRSPRYRATILARPTPPPPSGEASIWSREKGALPSHRRQLSSFMAAQEGHQNLLRRCPNWYSVLKRVEVVGRWWDEEERERERGKKISWNCSEGNCAAERNVG